MSKWKIAIYLRLSKDDGDKDESDSISSQRSMITSYIDKYLYEDSSIVGEFVDDGYTGEILVKLYNNSDEHYQVHAGDKISQLVVIPVLYEDIHIMDSLDENTERGAQGFGSSGK